MTQPVTLHVNGARRTVRAGPGEPLALVLRNRLGLIGPKIGCGLEQCGACAVLVDGESVLSCVRPAADFEGRRIETVEALGAPEAPGPVQQALLDERAAQCGYCTPGLVIAITALLRKEARPGEDAVRAALRPHLCRCGAHPRVLRAVRRLARASSTASSRTSAEEGHPSLRRPGAPAPEADGAPEYATGIGTGQGDPVNPHPSLARHPRVEDWIAVRPDGVIEVRTGKVEIGQGIATAIALVAARELGAPFEHVVTVPPRTGVSPDEGYTSGSNSMEHSGYVVRLAAATARRELVARAARRLGVEAASLEAEDGLVRSRETNRTIGFGSLVEDAPLALRIDPEAPLRSGPGQAPGHGRVVEPRNMRAIVTGTHCFVHDLRLKGLLHARVVRPPHHHAVLAALARGVEEGLEGATLLRDGSFLAVAHEDEHRAIRAAARVAAAATWRPVRALDDRPLPELLLGNPRESFPVRGGRPHRETVPPLPEAPPDAPRTLRAVYERPYQMHGSLAPSAALARLDGGELTVWTHSQGIYPMRFGIAQALDVESEKVHVVHAPGSGCYGHNGSDDAALEAAIFARAIPGRPVLLKWSREDEHAWEPYGSAMRMELCAHLDRGGNVRYWSHETSSDTHVMRTPPVPGGSEAVGRFLAPRYRAEAVRPPEPRPNLTVNGGIHRNATPPYAFPETRIVKHLVRDLPLRVSALRTLGAYANVFAAESFMDEAAHAAGADPLEYRRRHLEDVRLRAVLDAAAEGFGWTTRTAGGTENGNGSGVGRGIAAARYKNVKSYCAVAVELEVGDDAKVRLRRAVVAGDAGEVVDPEGLAAQLEGGFVQAASWTLHEAVTWDRDGITSRDWDGYSILRFDEVPEIETVLLDRPGEPFLGAGEASCGPAGAAIANAVFDAVGVRARRLPLTPDALRESASRIVP